MSLRFGAGTAKDLTWKQVLDTFSCTECGRCQDACPAFATGKILSPKLVIMGLRDPPFTDGGATSQAARERRASSYASLVPGAVPADIDLGLRHLRRLSAGVPGPDLST